MSLRVVVRRSLPFILGVFLLASGWAADPGARKKVLVLQSYNQGYSWSQSIEDGLASVLKTSEWDLWYDYLDAKNLPEGTSLAEFDTLFQAKYGSRTFDFVVTVDDPAYLYFASRRGGFFHGAPAAAIGLNAPPPARLDGVSYIIENPDFGKTLNLALRQHPRASTVHIVLDRSVTGLLIRQAIERTPLDRAVAIDWIDEGSINEVAARVVKAPPQDVLVFGIYFRPDDGYQSNDRFLRRIRNVSGMPVYAFWSFALAPGALGGYLYDGRTMGEAAARIVRDLGPAGKPEVYVDSPQGTWLFNWHEAQTYGLLESSFPKDSRFLDRPSSLWEINQTTVVLFLVGFGVLAGFTVLILFNLRTQRTLVTFGRTMIATQRELMHNLGNVIENRSEETASHVQRITGLSLLLADLLGLSQDQRTQLEVCAPMHDIGKVGIPDAILKKPGTLTPEEYEVMKTHTRIGHSIFQSSANPLVQAAARIALEHHEHWDGNGYPDGKAGAQIDLLARIVAVVDVFDALLTERTYKKAWEPPRVREFLESRAGTMFDPELIRLLVTNWDRFLAVWSRSLDR